MAGNLAFYLRVTSGEVDCVSLGAQPTAEADLMALGLGTGQAVEANTRMFRLIHPHQSDDLTVKGALEGREEEAAAPDGGLAICQSTMAIIPLSNGTRRLPDIDGKRDKSVPRGDMGVVSAEAPHPPCGRVHVESVNPAGS